MCGEAKSIVGQTRNSTICANVVQLSLESGHRVIIGMSQKPQQKSNKIH